MATYHITSPDGGNYEINAPDTATQDQVLAYAQQNHIPSHQATTQSNDSGYTFTSPSLDNLTTNLGTLGQGALGGAADIGNTLINTASYIPRKLANLAGSNAADNYNNNREAGVKEYNKNPDPVFQVGRIGAQIAGTAGVGDALAIGANAAKLPTLAEALRTGGMAGGNLATRVTGGALSGAGQAALINPDSAGTGAVIGGGIPLAGAGLKLLGKGAANLIGELGTHTGGESLQQAAKAGMEGGDAAQSFTDNLRGNVPMTDVLDAAKQNLQNMVAAKQAEYRTGMAQVSGDKSVLSFDGIDKALDNARDIVSYKGQVTNQTAAKVQQQISDAVNNWKNLDPAEYHTPEGLDALKKQISGIQESIPFEENTARKVAGGVYNAIKNEISDQAPVYSKVMKGYSDASEQIAEIQSALLGKNQPSADTAMRKLQSIMRNNVNTNYGNRLDLAKQLEQQGGNQIIPALAGQSLSSMAPRGLGKAVAGMTIGGGLATLNPAAIPLLAAQSPRLMGEGAFATGQLARLLKAPMTKIPYATGALANQLRGQE